MSFRNGIRKLGLTYNVLLERNTQLVQSIQTSALLALGDYGAQKFFEDKNQPYDYYRTARFAFVGVFMGPGLMAWYRALDKVLGKEQLLKISLKKVVLDQLIASPTVIVGFLGIHNFLQGKSVKEFKDSVDEKFTDILITNYKVWPAVQLLNFSLVPLQFRVLFVQCVALGWNTYLAWKLHCGKANVSSDHVLKEVFN